VVTILRFARIKDLDLHKRITASLEKIKARKNKPKV